MKKEYFFYFLFIFLILWFVLFLREINKIFIEKKTISLPLFFKTRLSPAPTLLPTTAIGANKNQELIKVTRIIDGDTIVLENGKIVRYIGIDTPELNVKKGKPECYALKAKKKNEELVFGKKVRLEKDVSETDKYGRLLRYVYVDDVFVNEYLVKEGYATILTYPPDVAYADLFLIAQQEAKENNRGLWGTDCDAKQ